jgi:hypothetical protein
VFVSSSEWPNGMRRRGGLFVAPQENLPVEVSETWTCPGYEPDMSGLWAGHIRPTSLEPGLGTGYVRF